VDSHECFLYLCKSGWPSLINSKLEIFYDNTFTNIAHVKERVKDLLQDKDGFKQICTKYNILINITNDRYLSTHDLDKISSVILYSRLKMINLFLVYVILIFGRSYGYSEEYTIRIIGKKGNGNSSAKKENLSLTSSEDKISLKDKEKTFSICFTDIYNIIELLLNNVEFFNEKELFYI
jgi:hypothetical protein